MHDDWRGEELSGLLAGRLSELFEQVLVGVAEGVVGDRLGVERDLVELVDQGDEGRLREALVVAPGGVPEDVGEDVDVRGLDLGERLPDATTEADLGGLGDLGPQGSFGDDEAVVVGFDLVGQVVAELLLRLVLFVDPGVADPLPEQQWEDVGLEVCGVDGAAQGVGRAPES